MMMMSVKNQLSTDLTNYHLRSKNEPQMSDSHDSNSHNEQQQQQQSDSNKNAQKFQLPSIDKLFPKQTPVPSSTQSSPPMVSVVPTSTDVSMMYPPQQQLIMSPPPPPPPFAMSPPPSENMINRAPVMFVGRGNPGTNSTAPPLTGIPMQAQFSFPMTAMSPVSRYSDPETISSASASTSVSPGGTPSTKFRHHKHNSSMDNRFRCDKCNKSYTRKHNLISHKLSAHEKEKLFSCPDCNVKFSRSSDLSRHSKEQHSANVKPFICGGLNPDGTSWGCGKRFHRKDQLKSHLSTSKAEFKCLRKSFAESQETGGGDLAFPVVYEVPKYQ